MGKKFKSKASKSESTSISMSGGILRLFNTAAISFLILISIIVASIFLPSCVSSEMKSKGNQSEVKGMLFFLSTSQDEYFEMHNCYTSDITLMDILPDPGSAKYYKIKIISADCNGYVARAWGNIDDDPEIDVWEITNESQLGPVNIYDDSTNTGRIIDPEAP